ncbi:MAG: cysteine desulfurase, partial [Sporichthyaceae bacterium]|nr:cysteine desulfurase [Sporichthyaceae bacterium]
MNPLIYLDYQATTPLDPRVLAVMLPYLSEIYGNPASPHAAGRQAADAVRIARRQLRDLLGAQYDNEIVFTSGATESDNLAIAGIAHTLRHQGNHMITTAIEHPAVLACCMRLAKDGWQVTQIPVNTDGLVDPDDIGRAITADTVLISVIHANNEIGTIQPVAEIGTIARARGVLLHTDAAQSLASEPVDVNALQVDLMSVSGHKIYGPKGIGALYLRRGTPTPTPLLAGGHQERGLRPGTPNVPAIVGLGAAAALLSEHRPVETRQIKQLRDHLVMALQAALPTSRINGTLT